MPGTLEDATRALAMYNESDKSHVLSMNGSTRLVYLINGVVYKVEWYSDWVNRSEYEVITSNRQNLPAGIFYPDVSLYTVALGIEIIAMEYVEGTAIYACYCDEIGDECDSECMTEQEKMFLPDLLDDSSGLNIIRNEDGYYIIDAA